MSLVSNSVSHRGFRQKVVNAWMKRQVHATQAVSPVAASAGRPIQFEAAEQAPESFADARPSRSWMKFQRAQQIVGGSKVLRRLTIGVFARLELLLLKGHKDRAALKRIVRCRRAAESLLTGNEAFFLYSLANAQRKLFGAMAELGVFQGCSARILCEAKEDRALHLFDTFAGLPQPGEIETGYLKRGQFAASLPAVQRLLQGYTNVSFHDGLFPNSATGLDGVRFSLVHLDADLYSSTLAGLEFFYPRMVPGGIILAHDYSTLPGVTLAFEEFLAGKPEAVIELPTTQAMIVVRGRKEIRPGVDARFRSTV